MKNRYGETSPHQRNTKLHLGLVVMVAGGLFLPGQLSQHDKAMAQQVLDVEQAKQRELKSVRESLKNANRRKTSLESERNALLREADEISSRLVELAARAQAREALIARNETRIDTLNGKEASLSTLLSMNRSAIAELLAGLQRLRRDPPPPFVTRPHDVLAALRGSLLLASAVPQIDKRVARLLSDLQRLSVVRGRLQAEQEEKRRHLARLRDTSREMEKLLARKRELLHQTDSRIQEENRRLATLARKAKTLGELLTALRRERKRWREAERLRRGNRNKLRGEKGRPPPSRGQEPGLRKPRVSFASLKGRLPWPAQGRRLLSFGEKTGLGSYAQGFYVSTRAGARVIAPADARVELAQPFRSYGQLLILDAGQGYRILLAGLHKSSVLAGQFVRAGEPVGEMGERPAPATVIGGQVEEDKPILYIELRKNGRPVNSTPWWLGSRQEARKK